MDKTTQYAYGLKTISSYYLTLTIFVGFQQNIDSLMVMGRPILSDNI